MNKTALKFPLVSLRFLALLGGLLLAAVPLPAQFVTVGSFAPANNASSITSTGGETISLADFSTLVSNAFASGTGGVVNFDNATLAGGSSSFTASWGIGGSQTLNVGAGLGFNTVATNFGTSANVSNRTPSSGGRPFSRMPLRMAVSCSPSIFPTRSPQWAG